MKKIIKKEIKKDLEHICPKCKKSNKESYAVCIWCGNFLRANIK